MPSEAVFDSKTPPSSGAPKGLKIAGGVVVCVAAVAVGWGVLSRQSQTQAAQRWSNTAAIPTVNLVSPAVAAATQAMSLPGALQAVNEARINARVTGYLKAWNVDIGAAVKPGQVLAVLDTPELDQQVAQARADLASAQAQRQLSQTTASRWKDLLSSDAVSHQEADEKSGDFAAKSALVHAQEANLQRLLALKSFARITAPFAGIITARNAEIGDLVNAGSGQPLFVVSDVSRMRVYVKAPQSLSSQLKPGQAATLHLPEYAGRDFPATLVRTSGAINDQSGTLLAELAAANPDQALKPGAFAQVDFHIPSQSGVLRLPASVLLFRKAGLEVAVLDAKSHVHLKRITIAQDLGPQVEVGAGLNADDRVIDNPPDSLADGQLVRVNQDEAAKAHG